MRKGERGGGGGRRNCDTLGRGFKLVQWEKKAVNLELVS